MSTYYNTHGVSARPKKRGGGLGSILGAMLGTGVSTGGTFNPAVDVDALAHEEFAGKGVDPTDEDASIDAWNSVREAQIAGGVTSKPASYTPYELKNPLLTQIFNPQLASQLESRNFAANQMMYGQQLQQEAAKQEYERRLALAQFEQNAYDNRQSEGARAAREQAELQHRLGQQGADAGVDRNLRIAKGLPSSVDVAPLGEPGMQHAMALARAQAAASSSPEFGPAVQRDMLARLDAQGIKNWNDSIYTAQPGQVGVQYDINKNVPVRQMPSIQPYTEQIPVIRKTEKGTEYVAGNTEKRGYNIMPEVDLAASQANRDARLNGTAPKNPSAPKPAPAVEVKPTTAAAVKAAETVAEPSKPSIFNDSEAAKGIQSLLDMFRKTSTKRDDESWAEYYKRTGKKTNN